MSGWARKIVSPKVLLPVVVIVGAIALLFGFGDPKKIIGIMESFNRVDLIWVFLLSVVYEAVRFTQWLFLMKREGVKAPIGAQIFAFAGGEATRFFPAGNYFQNYLLTTAEGQDFAFTSAASTLIIFLEVAVSLASLVVLGLGPWWWLRPVIVVGVTVFAGIVWLLYKLHGTLDPPDWVRRHERLKKAWEGAAGELHQFARGSRRIIHWRTLAISCGLTAIYLVTGGAILYIVLAGLGGATASFGDVLAVSFFSLAFGLIFPLPIDIGVAELSGVGAFLVVGVDRNTAIGAMLINRVLTVGFSVVIGIIVSVILRDEVRKAWSARGARQTGQVGHDKSEAEEPGDASEDSQSESHVRDTTGDGSDAGHAVSYVAGERQAGESSEI